MAEERGAALLLNCGDSRAVLAARRPNGWAVDFATRDHPQGGGGRRRANGDAFCEWI